MATVYDVLRSFSPEDRFQVSQRAREMLRPMARSVKRIDDNTRLSAYLQAAEQFKKNRGDADNRDADFQRRIQNLRGGGTFASPSSSSGGGGVGGGGQAPASGGTASTGDRALDTLLARMDAAQEAARAANEQRYREINQGYQELERDVMGQLEGVGEQTRKDILERYGELEARQLNDLVSRGLSGSTLRANIQEAGTRGATADIARLDESLRRDRAQALSNIRGESLRFKERRTDAYPEMASLMELYRSAGRSGLGDAQDGGGTSGGTDLMGFAGGGLTYRRETPSLMRRDSGGGGKSTQEQIIDAYRRRSSGGGSSRRQSYSAQRMAQNWADYVARKR